MNRLLSFLLTILLASPLIAQEGIYPGEAPSLEHIWTRIGDVSPKLRSVESAEFSPDGLTCISGSKFGYLLTLWNVADGTIIWQEKARAEIECVSFSPDGTLIACGDEDFFVTIREAESGKIVKSLEHDSGIDGLSWTHDGQYIVSGTEKGDLCFWDRKSWHLEKKRNCGSTINSIDFSADLSFVIVAGNNQIQQNDGSTLYRGFVSSYRLPDLELYQDYKGHTASVKSVRLSQNDSLAATASFDSTVCIWNIHSGELVHRFRESYRIEAVQFTPDGHFLISGGQSPQVRFYRMTDFTEAGRLDVPRAEYLDVSADGRLLLIACEDGGLIRLFMFLSQLQDKGSLYHKIADDQLDNRDLKQQ